LILGPVLEQFVRIRLLMDIFLTTIAISMVSVIGHRQKYLFKIGAVLAAVMILSLWVDNFFPIDAFAIASMIIGVIFTAIVIAHTLAFIINSKSVVKEVKTFKAAEDFLKCQVRERNACLISDIKLKGLSGLELQQQLAERGTKMPVIFLTAFDSNEIRQQAKQAGAAGYFRKPVDDQALLDTIHWAMSSSFSS
jgi:CheY-like chemotaxis protein